MLWWNIKRLDYRKRGRFLELRIDVSSLSFPFLAIFPLMRRMTRRPGTVHYKMETISAR
jgi:hypothetical protein